MGPLTELDTVIAYLTSVLAVGTLVLAVAGLLLLVPVLVGHHRARVARHESVLTYWRHAAAPVH